MILFFILDVADSITIIDSDENNEQDESILKPSNCSVCNIEIPSDELQLRQHLISQKHKKKYRILEEQQRINKKCGLFIKG